ncbi:hypothetical protein [Salaquimonas pukyongi]|nr:hypothetical protein [Salaquimonas pukyongi]
MSFQSKRNLSTLASLYRPVAIPAVAAALALVPAGKPRSAKAV